MRRIPYLTDQHLQHILQRHQPQHLAGTVGSLRQMGGCPAHHRQRLVQREFHAQRGHRAPDLLRHRPVPVLQVEHILDVEVAHEGAALSADREAGVPGAHGQLLDLGWG